MRSRPSPVSPTATWPADRKAPDSVADRRQGTRRLSPMPWPRFAKRMMQKKPEARFASMRKVADVLREWISRPCGEAVDPTAASALDLRRCFERRRFVEVKSRDRETSDCETSGWRRFGLAKIVERPLAPAVRRSLGADRSIARRTVGQPRHHLRQGWRNSQRAWQKRRCPAR